MQSCKCGGSHPEAHPGRASDAPIPGWLAWKPHIWQTNRRETCFSWVGPILFSSTEEVACSQSSKHPPAWKLPQCVLTSWVPSALFWKSGRQGTGSCLVMVKKKVWTDNEGARQRKASSREPGRPGNYFLWHGRYYVDGFISGYYLLLKSILRKMIMGASSSRLRNLLSNFQWTVVFPGHIIMIVLVMVVIMQTASCQRALFISHCSQPYCFEVNRGGVMSIQGTERSSTPRKSSPGEGLPPRMPAFCQGPGMPEGSLSSPPQPPCQQHPWDLWTNEEYAQGGVSTFQFWVQPWSYPLGHAGAGDLPWISRAFDWLHPKTKSQILESQMSLNPELELKCHCHVAVPPVTQQV